MPANIKLGADGSALKILDFGLAKAVEPDAASDPSMSQSPTMTLAATMRGEILGTAAYMSPEQARGGPTDPRTDIWAFGVCLYEALAGRGAFASETAADSMARILQMEPDWEALPGDLPLPVLRLLRRCLTKDARERLQHIGDARLEILEAQDPTLAFVSVEPTPAETAVGGRRSVLAMGILAALAIGVAGWALLTRPTEVEPVVRRLVIDLPSSEELVPGPARSLAVSGDGRTLVYVGQQSGGLLFQRSLDALEAFPIPGTEGARNPFFSPDGEWVGFFADGRVRKVSLRGGLPVEVCTWPEIPIGARTATSTLERGAADSRRCRLQAAIRRS